MKLSGRQIAILVLLCLFAVVAVAPVFLIGNRDSSSGSSDIAYQALKVYSRSQLGDRSADAAALKVYPTLKRTSEDGKEYFSRVGANNTCWELDISKSSEPYKAAADRCSKE